MVLEGIIKRRLLVNFRIQPDRLKVPEPFRLQLVDGWAIGGICLIRLEQIRPRGTPRLIGLSSENAAHRIAIEGGVYVPRRDTSSCINVLAGGMLFPGRQNLARFQTQESEDRVHIHVTSQDSKIRLDVQGQTTRDWPTSSVFKTPEQASQFFQKGCIGYSPSPTGHEAMELYCPQWQVEPFQANLASSSYFSQLNAEYDCTLLMRNLPHEWRQVS